MLEILFSLWPIWLILAEIFILLGCYKFYISNLNATVWEKRAREEGWLVSILQPVIMETTEMVSASVLEAIEQKYRQSQGVLARVAGKNPETVEEGGLVLAEEILKAMNFKSPGILMVARMASTLAGLAPVSTGEPVTMDAEMALSDDLVKNRDVL